MFHGVDAFRNVGIVDIIVIIDIDAIIVNNVIVIISIITGTVVTIFGIR